MNKIHWGELANIDEATLHKQIDFDAIEKDILRQLNATVWRPWLTAPVNRGALVQALEKLSDAEIAEINQALDT